MSKQYAAFILCITFVASPALGMEHNDRNKNKNLVHRAPRQFNLDGVGDVLKNTGKVVGTYAVTQLPNMVNAAKDVVEKSSPCEELAGICLVSVFLGLPVYFCCIGPYAEARREVARMPRVTR